MRVRFNPYEAQTLLGVNTGWHQTLVQTFTIVTFFETRDSDQLFRSGVLQIFAQDFSDNVHLKA